MPALDRPTQQEIQSFEMPQVAHGTAVAWYPNGTRSRAPEVAFVIRTSHRNVHLATATRGVREAVRHVDDPKLQLNADQREMGAWDFTDHHKELVRRMDRIEQQMASCERAITGLTTGAAQAPKRSSQKTENKKPKFNPEENQRRRERLLEYHRLKREAQSLGVEFDRNPKQAWLEEQIQSKRAATTNPPVSAESPHESINRTEGDTNVRQS